MRRVPLLLVVVLLLAACAETVQPGASPAPPGSVATATPLLPGPTDTAPAGAAPATSAPLAVEPTPVPAPPSPAPEGAGMTQAPWPRFLRELDFSIPAGNSYDPRALAVHPGLGRLYVRTSMVGADSRRSGAVTVLDLESGEVLSVVPAGSETYDGGELAAGPLGGRLYVLDPEEGTCLVLEAETYESIATLDGVDRFALDAEGGRLYAGGPGGLRVLDTVAYDVSREVPLAPAPQYLLMAVDAVHDRLYTVYRQDGAYTLGVYQGETLDVLGATPLPGPPDDLVPDPDRGRLFLALNDGQNSLLWTLDGEGRLLGEQVLGDWTRTTRLALDPGGNRLFLSRDVYQDYGITVLDLGTGQEAVDIPLDLAPNALLWVAARGELFVSHTYQNQIAVVDVEAGQACAERGACVRAVFPTALNLVDLALDPRRSHLYVTDSIGRLHVLNSESDKALALLPGAGRISVDSAHGRLYTGGEGARQVRVFDVDSLQQTGEIRSPAIPVADAHGGGLYLVDSGVYIASLETMTITGVISDTLPQYPGFSPNPAAVDAVVDPGSGRIFAIINNGVAGSNNGNYLYAYEPVTYEKILTDTERSPIYVDVDPNNGRAYVSRIHLAGRSIGLFDPGGRAYTARLDAVFGALRVDPALGRLYLTTDGTLLILDATNLDVLGSVSIPDGFGLCALDPWRDLLYLATEGGRVQVWSALGGTLPGPVEPIAARVPADEVSRLFRSPQDRTLFAGSLYRSDDDGATWQYLAAGLPQRTVQEVAVSPNLEQDGTLFAAMAATDEGWGVWKTTDGGQTWRMVDRGLSDLAMADLAISPAFGSDETLFATTRKQGLFRSTDGGGSWVRLTGRYHPDDGSQEPPGVIAVSPTYGRDRTLFFAHYGLQRSTDGGESWVQVLPQEPDSLAFSPDFARDGTVFGWFGSGGLLRSTDGGETWSAASVGLSLSGYGNGQVMVAPDFAGESTQQTLYFAWLPSRPDASVQLYRSTDAAATWWPLSGPVPQGVTPLQLSADGTALVALDEAGRLARWPVAELAWQAPALPPIDEVTFQRLILSPDFAQDQTLLAVSEGLGILRSDDAGRTWADTHLPLRQTSGEPLQPLILAPDTILLGSALGLYRLDEDGLWAPVGGGLPPAVATTSPVLGANGSLRVLVGPGGGQRVFLSTDGGRTWTQPIPALPDGAAAKDLVFSPAFATDHTAFLVTSWEKPRRTVGGAEWEVFGPPGDWTVSALDVSPAFDQDGLLLMRRQDDSLWRSVDRGDTWAEIDGPWGDEAPEPVIWGSGYPHGSVTFSPSFDRDHVLLTEAGNTMYRSTDGGRKWRKVLTLESFFGQALFSPDYGRDGTIYLLLGNTFFRSADAGRNWQALPPAPWSAGGEIHWCLSPDFGRDQTLLAWTRTGVIYQSGDGGQSWLDVSAGLSAVWVSQVIFSPGYASDGTAYLLPSTPGLYKRVGDGPWLPITAGDGSPAATPPPGQTPPAATRTPAATPPAVACASEPVLFPEVWQQAGTRLGCPLDAAVQVLFAYQPFEHGRMIWDSSTGQIYVLGDGGSWQAFDDTFVEGQDPASDPALEPPPGRLQPVRGFGKVWREQLEGPQSTVGWALQEERAVKGWRQPFEEGLLVWMGGGQDGTGKAGTAYLLYDGGTWEALDSPAP